MAIKKGKYRIGQLVYYKNLTYRIAAIDKPEDYGTWYYRLKKDGHIFSIWVEEYDLQSHEQHISSDDILKNFFESLVK